MWAENSLCLSLWDVLLWYVVAITGSLTTFLARCPFSSNKPMCFLFFKCKRCVKQENKPQKTDHWRYNNGRNGQKIAKKLMLENWSPNFVFLIVIFEVCISSAPVTRTLKEWGHSSTVKDLNSCAVSDCVTINPLCSLRLINSVLSLFLLFINCRTCPCCRNQGVRVLKYLSTC